MDKQILEQVIMSKGEEYMVKINEKKILKNTNVSDGSSVDYGEKINKIIEKQKDIKVPLSQLHRYFNTTIEEYTEHWDKEINKKYTNYYIKPSIPFDVQIQDMMISFYDQDIKMIKVVKYLDEVPYNDYRTTLYFYDENVEWLEDIDINTNVNDEEITFIFTNEDLQISATNNNTERQAYIELDEKLNIWADNEENRKTIREWFYKYWRKLN